MNLEHAVLLYNYELRTRSTVIQFTPSMEFVFELQLGQGGPHRTIQLASKSKHY